MLECSTKSKVDSHPGPGACEPIVALRPPVDTSVPVGLHCPSYTEVDSSAKWSCVDDLHHERRSAPLAVRSSASSLLPTSSCGTKVLSRLTPA